MSRRTQAHRHTCIKEIERGSHEQRGWVAIHSFIHSFSQSFTFVRSQTSFLTTHSIHINSYHIHIISYFVKIRTVLTNLHRVAATPSPPTLASPPPLPRPRSQQRRKRRKRRRRKKKRKRISSTHARSIGRQETRGRVNACH